MTMTDSETETESRGVLCPQGATKAQHLVLNKSKTSSCVQCSRLSGFRHKIHVTQKVSETSPDSKRYDVHQSGEADCHNMQQQNLTGLTKKESQSKTAGVGQGALLHVVTQGLRFHLSGGPSVFRSSRLLRRFSASNQQTRGKRLLKNPRGDQGPHSTGQDQLQDHLYTAGTWEVQSSCVTRKERIACIGEHQQPLWQAFDE